MSTKAQAQHQVLRLQELAARDMVSDYREYRRMVMVDGTLAERRKLLDLQVRLTGAEPTKGDEKALLPTFNFVFHGGVQAQATVTAPAPEAEPEVLEAETLPELPPPTDLGDLPLELGLPVRRASPIEVPEALERIDELLHDLDQDP